MNVTIQTTTTTPRGTRTLLLAEDGCFYVVSTVTTPDGGSETLVFPARSTGEVIECSDVAGGRGVSHEGAIERLRALSAADVADRLDTY